MLKVALFTTTDTLGNRQEEFDRLIDSLKQQANVSSSIKIFILLQNSSEEVRNRLNHQLPSWVTLYTWPTQLSLSAARNFLFSSVRDHDIFNEDTIVGFPDDDCWYPSHLLEKITLAFSQDEQLDLLICGVSLRPIDPSWSVVGSPQASVPAVVRRSSSNSVFFRGSLIAQIGDFDPTLGLGTPNFGGEDTDFTIRGYIRSRRSVFIEHALVGHPESNVNSVAKYFRGTLLVLARHARHSGPFMREYIRKLAVGAYLVATQRMSLMEYQQSVRRSAAKIGR